MSGVRLGGPVRIHPTAFVAPGAVVAGDVTLGPRSSVWFNTVVRGDSAPVEVGEDTNLQDNSVVHVDEGQPALIGSRVTVGHRAIVHGCVIEEDCLVGMGSVLLSGARIGAGSLIGAASLVREGQVIPAGSLVVGSPARVIGPAAPAHREAIRRGAAHYADLSRLYMETGLARHADRSGTLARDTGPMTWLEWQRLLATLRDLPARVGEMLGGSRDRWDAEVLSALALWRDRDGNERLPALKAMVRGEEALLSEVTSAAGPPAGNAAAGLAEWAAVRGELAVALETCETAQWNRIAGHPTRGAFTLADLAREWIEDDLEGLRGIARAMGGRE